MKKRAKLITTIASLSLAVALMAFGVYAATQVTFNVTSTVKFTAQDVYITISGSYCQSASSTPDSSASELADWSSYTGSTPKTPLNPGEEIDSDDISDLTWEIGDIELTSAESYMIYVITISNDDGKPVNIAVSENTGTFAGSNLARAFTYTVTNAGTPQSGDATGTDVAIAASGVSITKLLVGDSVTFTYIANVVDKAQDVVGGQGVGTEFQIDLQFVVTQWTAA